MPEPVSRPMSGLISPPDTRPSLLDLGADELLTLVAELGAPAYRVRQITQSVYRRFALRFEPEPACALAISRHSIVRDELALGCHLKTPLHFSQRPFVAM